MPFILAGDFNLEPEVLDYSFLCLFLLGPVKHLMSIGGTALVTRQIVRAARKLQASPLVQSGYMAQFCVMLDYVQHCDMCYSFAQVLSAMANDQALSLTRAAALHKTAGWEQWVRKHSVNGLCSEQLSVEQTILPGCLYATCLLQLMLIGVLLKAELHRVDMIIALDKSRVLANSPELQAELQRRLVSVRALAVHSERNLGVDFSAARATRRRTRAARIPVAKAKLKRLRHLQGASARKKTLQHMARAAIETTVTFGTSVQGTSMTELDTLRTLAAAALDSRSSGRSRTMALLLTPSPRMDPIYRATLEPVKAFMHVLWRDLMPQRTLEKGIAAAAARLGPHSSPWQAIKGPFSALWASLHRVGVDCSNLRGWIFPNGQVVNPLELCPRSVEALVERAVVSWQMQKISQHFEAPEFLEGIWIEPLRSLCFSRLLTASEGAYLRSVAIGGQWPQARQHAQGWVESPECLICHDGDGTLAHRHARCSCIEELGTPVPERVALLSAQAFHNKLVEIFLERGVLGKPRVPPDLLQWPLQPYYRWEGNPVNLTGDVFVDGSLYEDLPTYPVAGFSCVSLKPNGDVVATVLTGVLPGPHQDIDGAELYALYAVLLHATPPVIVHSDSSFVVKGVNLWGREHTTAAGFSWAHLWRLVWDKLDDWGDGVQVIKVKSHVTQKAVLEGVQSYRHTFGNKCADEEAKVRAHDRRPALQFQKLTAQHQKFARGLGVWIAQVGAVMAETDCLHRVKRGFRNRVLLKVRPELLDLLPELEPLVMGGEPVLQFLLRHADKVRRLWDSNSWTSCLTCAVRHTSRRRCSMWASRRSTSIIDIHSFSAAWLAMPRASSTSAWGSNATRISCNASFTHTDVMFSLLISQYLPSQFRRVESVHLLVSSTMGSCGLLQLPNSFCVNSLSLGQGSLMAAAGGEGAEWSLPLSPVVKRLQEHADRAASTWSLIPYQPDAGEASRGNGPDAAAADAPGGGAAAGLRQTDLFRLSSGAGGGHSCGVALEAVRALFSGIPPQPSRMGRSFEWRCGAYRILLGCDLVVLKSDGWSSDLSDCTSFKVLPPGGGPEPSLDDRLDVYLENIMCHIPKVAWGCHNPGGALKWRVFDTNDLPAASTASEGGFDAELLQDQGHRLLHFLRQRCHREGGTYWLFREQNSSSAELFDLTTLADLPVDHSHSRAFRTTPSLASPIASLCFRLAKGTPSTADQRQLLQKCLHLLDPRARSTLRSTRPPRCSWRARTCARPRPRSPTRPARRRRLRRRSRPRLRGLA
ncbi:unnamed protein product, partial [Prorocentrum cordatum]